MQVGVQYMEAQAQNLSHVEQLQQVNNTRFPSGKATENRNEKIDYTMIVPGSFITLSWLLPSPKPPRANATPAAYINGRFTVNKVENTACSK